MLDLERFMDSFVNIYDNKIWWRDLIDLHQFMLESSYTWSNYTQSTSFGDEPTHYFFGNLYYERDNVEDCPSIIEDLWNYVADELELDKSYLQSISSNLQVYGQEADWHTDPGETIMVYPACIWRVEWGGNFLMNPEDPKEIEYIPGRIIHFDGKIPHKAYAPKFPKIPRFSIVFRIKGSVV